MLHAYKIQSTRKTVLINANTNTDASWHQHIRVLYIHTYSHNVYEYMCTKTRQNLCRWALMAQRICQDCTSICPGYCGDVDIYNMYPFIHVCSHIVHVRTWLPTAAKRKTLSKIIISFIHRPIHSFVNESFSLFEDSN